jgi:hypothetical protein
VVGLDVGGSLLARQRQVRRLWIGIADLLDVAATADAASRERSAMVEHPPVQVKTAEVGSTRIIHARDRGETVGREKPMAHLLASQ